MPPGDDLWLCHLCGRRFRGSRDTCAECYRTTCADCFDTSNGGRKRKCKGCARDRPEGLEIEVEE